MKKKILVQVRYIVKEGKREEFLNQILDEGIQKACLQEDGCEKYDYYFPADDSNALCLCEIWRDADALQVHGTQPHFLRLGEIKGDYVVEMIVNKYQVEAL
ncbi:MAG: antibiotic biosynthesis monooxygenase [Lachnospiraceae bacterium]|nr:antibiotic biosynthesis monooxygenase [Lachnospiraceae bacterium]